MDRFTFVDGVRYPFVSVKSMSSTRILRIDSARETASLVRATARSSAASTAWLRAASATLI